MALKSPASLLFDVQADRLPASKPSAKIKSDPPGVFVAVGVRVAVLVGVIVGVFVNVGDGPIVAVFVAVAVKVGDAIAVFVGVIVAVLIGSGPRARKLNASTSLAVSPHVLPSK